MTDTPVERSVPLTLEIEGRPSARAITTFIVLATVAAAAIAYLLNASADSASADFAKAQQLSIQASARLRADRTLAETEYETYVHLQANHAAAGQTVWEAHVNGGAWRARAAVAKTVDSQPAPDPDVAAAIARDFAPDSPLGPILDRAFPTNFFAVASVGDATVAGATPPPGPRSGPGPGATVIAAQQQLANETASEWSKRSSRYTAALTVIAVALFLLGSALTLRGRSRRMFTILGVVILAASSVFVFVISLGRRATVPASAPFLFGQAERDLALASTPADNVKPISEFKGVVHEWPSFAHAYHELANAEFSAGSRQLGSALLSNVSAEALTGSISDDERAYSGGDSDVTVAADLGFDHLLLWEQTGHSSDLHRAELLANRAVKNDPTDAISLFSLGVIELAAGQTRASHDAYAKATAQVRTTTYPQALIGGALTDLGNLADAAVRRGDGPLLDQVCAAKERLIGWISGAVPLSVDGSADTSHGDMNGLDAGAVCQPSGPLKIPASSLGLAIFDPNGAQLNITQPTTDILPQTASVQWYYRPTGSSSWSVIADISSWGSGGSNPLQKSGSDYADVENFLDKGALCLPNADYRAEVYVNGHFAGSTPIDTVTTNGDVSQVSVATNNDVVPGLSRSLGLAMCRPRDFDERASPNGWARLSNFVLSDAVTGLTSSADGLGFGYTSHTGTTGAFMFRLQPGRDQFTGGTTPATDQATQLAQIATSVLGYLPPEPGLPHNLANTPPTVVVGALPSGNDPWTAAPDTDPFKDSYFMNTDGADGWTLKELIEVDGTKVLLGVARDVTASSDGEKSFVAGIVFGPDASFDPTHETPTLFKVFNSFTTTS